MTQLEQLFSYQNKAAFALVLELIIEPFGRIVPGAGKVLFGGFAMFTVRSWNFGTSSGTGLGQPLLKIT